MFLLLKFIQFQLKYLSFLNLISCAKQLDQYHSRLGIIMSHKNQKSKLDI